MKRIWEKLRGLNQRDKTSRDSSNVDKILDDDTHHRLAFLTLVEYIALIAEVPLPTIQQRENVVEFVSHGHSWYKHLPYFLPGVPFYFFIDKYAGWDRAINGDGTPVMVERAGQGFHYSDIPTQEYRTRFGHLAYSCGSGTRVFKMVTPLVVPRDKSLAVPGAVAQMYGLPEEILEGGLANLTAVIHTLSACYPFWHGKYWPEESGGQAVLEKLIARCRIMREPGFREERMKDTYPGLIHTDWNAAFSDRILIELVAPERSRQYGEMKKAIDRVCENIDSQRKKPTHQD